MGASMVDVGDDVEPTDGGRSHHVPVWTFLVGSVVGVIGGALLLPVARENVKAHVLGWVLAGIVAGVCTGLYFRADAAQAGRPGGGRGWRLTSVVVVVAIVGLCIGAVNAWAVATEWSIVE